MYSVLLQEDSAEMAVDEPESFSIAVTVLIEGSVDKPQVSFAPVTGDNYKVEAQSIQLVGSGGSPREFPVNFTISASASAAGYTFATPALKFFQGSSKNAGIRVNPSSEVSATVTLFNTKGSGDPCTCEKFSLLFVAPNGALFSHDPTIIWDPPGGGA